MRTNRFAAEANLYRLESGSDEPETVRLRFVPRGPGDVRIEVQREGEEEIVFALSLRRTDVERALRASSRAERDGLNGPPPRRRAARIEPHEIGLPT